MTRYHYFARRNELLLDIDNRASIRAFLKNYPIILLKAKKSTILNPRKDHLPVYITLERNYPYDVLFTIECWLGSDPRRECANFTRLASGATKPSLLIEHQRVPDFRKPDSICSCPRNFPGTTKKMPSCEHLINNKNFNFYDGTLWHQIQKLGFPEISDYRIETRRKTKRAKSRR